MLTCGLPYHLWNWSSGSSNRFSSKWVENSKNQLHKPFYRFCAYEAKKSGNKNLSFHYEYKLLKSIIFKWIPWEMVPAYQIYISFIILNFIFLESSDTWLRFGTPTLTKLLATGNPNTITPFDPALPVPPCLHVRLLL